MAPPIPGGPPLSISTAPPPQPAGTATSRHRRNRRLITLYDASLHRATFQGLLPLPPTNSTHPLNTTNPTYRTQSTYHHPPHAPDEILGRRSHNLFSPSTPLPWSDEVLPLLPSSDLLKAVHQYASEFYHKLGLTPGGQRGMDETGLLAVGCLIEEAVREGLGRGGERAFVDQESESDGQTEGQTEGQRDGEDDEERERGDQVQGKRKRRGKESRKRRSKSGAEEERKSEEGKEKKRRRKKRKDDG